VSMLNTVASVRWTAPGVGAAAGAVAVAVLHERSSDDRVTAAFDR